MALQLSIRGPEGQYQTLTADKNLIFVGRREGNDVVLPYPFVSGRHCRIFRHGTKLYVEDVGSTNGILVNGESVPAQIPHALLKTDVVQIGKVEIRAEWIEEAEVIAAPEKTMYEDVDATPADHGSVARTHTAPVTAPRPATAAPPQTDSPATMWEIQTGVFSASSMHIDDHNVGDAGGNVPIAPRPAFQQPAAVTPARVLLDAQDDARNSRLQLWGFAFQALGLLTLFGAIVLLVIVLLS